ncbi:MAG: putative membrane protein [Polaribacter sp.]|jgi:uncharacterized membrane protein
MNFYNIPAIEWLALMLFILHWAIYTWFADFSRWSENSLPKVMNFHRIHWMREMVKRQLRMPDVIMMGNFLHSSVFFASTAILIIGGLVAALGASDKSMQAITALPFVTTVGQGLWELKIVALISVFIYAFVKFIWAMRLADYSSILFNAAPFNDNEIGQQYATELGQIAGLFAWHFNQGLRANLFALALLGWWVNAWFFIACTSVIVTVLYRREFCSKSLVIANNIKELTESSLDNEVKPSETAETNHSNGLYPVASGHLE